VSKTRNSEVDLGKWILTAFAVAASCTTFEKSDQELNGLVASTGGRSAGGFSGSAQSGSGGSSGSTGGSSGSLNSSGGIISGGRVCGNGVREGSELCDGDDIGSETCASVTANPSATGFPLCRVNCTIDSSPCIITGGGGFGGTTGMGGRAGTIGFDASSCAPFGASCATTTPCCGNLTCFGACCFPVGRACAGDGDCCPFDQCRPQGQGGQTNVCCHANGVECQSAGECCSGICTQRGAGYSVCTLPDGGTFPS
jgi:hypothetical protein